jgi:hypothetical protein
MEHKMVCLFYYGKMLINAPHKLRLRKMGLALLAFLASSLVSISSSYAGATVQNFTNNTFSQNLFGFVTSGTPVTPVVAVFSNSLNVIVSAMSSPESANAGLQGLFNLVGDYDIQVDFNLYNWPDSNVVNAGIITPGYRVVLINNGAQNYYRVYFSESDIHDVPTADSSGRIRLTRAGDTISAYYLDTYNSWQFLASKTDLLLAAPTGFYIGGLVDNQFVSAAVQVTFDNLKVTNASLPGSTAPIVGIFLLND